DMEMFLESFAPVFRLAAIDTVNMLLSGATFDKSKWNTYLQKAHGINKRHANILILTNVWCLTSLATLQNIHSRRKSTGQNMTRV
ncbi:hypothetical protein, partial [Streptococcus pneumoniae]|uniref:hypothetical protein n=1 Tax=Streptococcus pneumoniae TaxID=1313 RepID=UPI001E42C11A